MFNVYSRVFWRRTFAYSAAYYLVLCSLPSLAPPLAASSHASSTTRELDARPCASHTVSCEPSALSYHSNDGHSAEPPDSTARTCVPSHARVRSYLVAESSSDVPQSSQVYWPSFVVVFRVYSQLFFSRCAMRSSSEGTAPIHIVSTSYAASSSGSEQSCTSRLQAAAPDASSHSSAAVRDRDGCYVYTYRVPGGRGQMAVRLYISRLSSTSSLGAPPTNVDAGRRATASRCASPTAITLIAKCASGCDFQRRLRNFSSGSDIMATRPGSSSAPACGLSDWTPTEGDTRGEGSLRCWFIS